MTAGLGSLSIQPKYNEDEGMVVYLGDDQPISVKPKPPAAAKDKQRKKGTDVIKINLIPKL